jgi:hypothetical protein
MSAIRADLSALDWKYRAKRTAQMPCEYAIAIHGYRRKLTPGTLVSFTLAAALVAGAVSVYLGA